MATAPSVALDVKKVSEFQSTNAELATQAKECDVVTEDDYLAAGSLIDMIVARKNAITKFFEDPAKQANALHKWITTQRSVTLLPLEQADVLLRNRRADWRAAEERKRREEEDRQRAEAKKEIEKQAVQEATVMQSMGDDKAANEIIDRAVTAPPPAILVPSTVPKEKGKSYRKVYDYRVINKALIKPEFLIPDDSAIGGLVSKLGFDAAGVVGGIEVTEGEVEVVRRNPGL